VEADASRLKEVCPLAHVLRAGDPEPICTRRPLGAVMRLEDDIEAMAGESIADGNRVAAVL